MAAVEKRSNSRMTFATSDEQQTYASGISRSTISLARRSCASLRNENKKPMTTERMPRFWKTRMASKTWFSSSGVSTRPSGGRMRSVTGIRLRRLTSGRFCHGTSKWSEKLCGRLWRPICRMSRKFRVVIMPTSAPLCSMVMLVAMVVP